MAMTRWVRRTRPQSSIVAHRADTAQSLLVADLVWQHVQRHRQVTPWATEAGGQLFGKVDAENICVIEASGPYRLDERSRHRYRSDPSAAQRAIEDSHRRGLLYLGEWHTHAEDYPSPSGLDDDAMRRLISGSRLNTSSLLMMIVGREPSIRGLALWSVSDATADRWIIECNL